MLLLGLALFLLTSNWLQSLHVLQKPELDPEELSNSKPISNLPFLVKLLKYAVAAQLKEHLPPNDLFEEFQSGFKTKP